MEKAVDKKLNKDQSQDLDALLDDKKKQKGPKTVIKEDLIKIIELILYIGRKYDQLSLSDHEDMKHMDAYQLISGFDEDFVKNNIKQLQEKFFIQ